MKFYIDLIAKNLGQTREEIRTNLINIFLQEKPGTGKGDKCSVYIYFVEVLRNGEKIYLKRPGRLNKGFDFEVNVSNMNFGLRKKSTMPSHKNILDDLTNKRKESLSEYLKMRLMVDKMYSCENITDEEMLSLGFTTGYPSDLILKVIKWLFIEQDITYWNWSGRAMLFNSICNLEAKNYE